MSGGKFKKVPKCPLGVAGGIACAAAIWFAASGGKEDHSPAPGKGLASVEMASLSPEQLHQRIATSPVKDYPDLMRQLLLVKDAKSQQEMIAELMRRWITTDAESFTAYLDAVEIDGELVWNRLAPAWMAVLDNLDPKLAGSFLIRDTTTRIILRSAETDAPKALAWARERLTENHLDMALSGIAAELVFDSSDAAMDLVSQIKSLSNRMEAAVGVGLVVGERDPEVALTWARSFTTEIDRTFVLSGVLSGMADRDPSRAAAEYAALVEAMKNEFRQRVLADRAAIGATVAEEYEGLSPEEIVKAELAKPNPNLIYLEKAAFIIGTVLTREDPESALAWARSLDIYQGGAAALEAVFEEWAGSAPETAFQSYVQQSGRRPEIAERLFNAWAMSDAEAASTAALTLATGEERNQAVAGVARGWIDSGTAPEAVAKWADILGSEAEKDQVRGVVVSETAFENPVLALKQIERMSNRGKAAELFHEVFPSLATNHPKVAREALASVKLSQVETEYFENMLRK